MPIINSGFGLRAGCPVCRQRIEQGRRKKRLGPFDVHPQCTALCPLCDEEVTEPPVGRRHEVDTFCGKPAHTACKREQA